MIVDALKQLANQTLKPFDLVLTRYSHLQHLAESNSKATGDLNFMLKLPEEHTSLLLRHLGKSKSQLRQDLFVLSELGLKTNGFFVEFGATNGVDLSNTHLLETTFQWSGILAEPARCWHDSLRHNRRCHISTDCVWSKSNATLVFNEVDTAELSTINNFGSSDGHHQARNKGKTYDVRTISLIDLLERYAAPTQIDYLSIDTEGSEFEILNSFDFDKYQISVITCEHNFGFTRELIFNLLTSRGYTRRFEELSAWDDWYVKT